ncbi:MAG: hypothetical protein F4237_12435 [Gemmatimonadetes bacterium]|nr:hypothetical protein [Gemmatimonadota bacterium]
MSQPSTLAPVVQLDESPGYRPLALEFKRLEQEIEERVRQLEAVKDAMVDCVEAAGLEETAAAGVRTYLKRTPAKPGYVKWEAMARTHDPDDATIEKFRRPERPAKAEWVVEISRAR